VSTGIADVWGRCKSAARGVTLSRVQAIVGTLAGLASVAGVVFSVAQVTRPPKTGQLLAVVQTAGSHRTVTDATVEVRTTDNAVVATLSSDAAGRATQELREGIYIVHVSHPRYAAEERRIQVLPRQTTEIRTTLRPGSAGSSSTADRAIAGGVSAVRKALRF
jgi:carboxypeptidase family protein